MRSRRGIFLILLARLMPSPDCLYSARAPPESERYGGSPGRLLLRLGTEGDVAIPSGFVFADQQGTKTLMESSGEAR